MQSDALFRFAETYVHVFMNLASESSVEDTIEILLGGINFTTLSSKISKKVLREYFTRSLSSYGVTLWERGGHCLVGTTALFLGNALLVASKSNPKSLKYKLGDHLVSSFVWWQAVPSYHQYLFSRMLPVRALEYMGRLATPAPLRRIVQLLMGTNDANYQADHAQHISEIATNYGRHIAEQGPWAAVLHVNLVPYLSEFLIDQAFWMSCYVRQRKTWRRVVKHHAVATSIKLAEIGIGLAARYTFSKTFHTLLPRANGKFAYWGENVGHYAVGYFAVRYIARLASVVHTKVDTLIPSTEADIEADQAEQEEMHKEEEEMRDRMHNFTPDGEDYYAVLQVHHHATEDEIRKQYRKMALTLHPDKLAHLPTAEREEKSVTFKKVSEAYSVLANQDKRRQYDSVKRTPKVPGFIDHIASKSPAGRIAILAGLGTTLVYVGAFTAYTQMLVGVKMLCAPGTGGISNWMTVAALSEQFSRS